MTISSNYQPLRSSTNDINPQRAVSQVPQEPGKQGTDLPKFTWAQGIARATLRVVSAPITLIKAMASKVLNLLYGRSDATPPRARPTISSPFYASPPSPSIKLFTPDPEIRWRSGVPEGMSQNRASSATASTVVSEPPSPPAGTPVDPTIRWRPGALEGMTQNRPASATVSTVASEPPSPPPRTPVDPTIRWRPGVVTHTTPQAAAGSKPGATIATPAAQQSPMAWRSQVLEQVSQTEPMTAASARDVMMAWGTQVLDQVSQAGSMTAASTRESTSGPVSTKMPEPTDGADGKAPGRNEVRLSYRESFHYFLEETTTIVKRILRPKDETPADPGPNVS